MGRTKDHHTWKRAMEVTEIGENQEKTTTGSKTPGLIHRLSGGPWNPTLRTTKQVPFHEPHPGPWCSQRSINPTAERAFRRLK